MIWLVTLSLSHAACGPSECADPDVQARLAALPDGPREPAPIDVDRPDEIRRAVFALG